MDLLRPGSALEEVRRESATRRVLLATAGSLAVFTVLMVGGWLLQSFSFMDLLVTLLADAVVGAMLLLAARGAWRAASYALPLLFLLLSFALTVSSGTWSPMPAFFALAIVVSSTLLEKTQRNVMYVILLLAYPLGGVLHGERDLRELLPTFVSVSAPLVGIILLLRFALRRLEGEVAERRLAEGTAGGSEARLRAVFESIGDSIMVLDGELTVLDCNEAAVAIHEMESKEELIGVSILELVPPSDRDSLREMARQALSDGQGGTFRRRVLRRGGAEFEAQIVARVFRNPDGTSEGFVVATRDITRQLATERQLRQAQKLQAVGQLPAGSRTISTTSFSPSGATQSSPSRTLATGALPERTSTRCSRRATAPRSSCGSCWPSAAARKEDLGAWI